MQRSAESPNSTSSESPAPPPRTKNRSILSVGAAAMMAIGSMVGYHYLPPAIRTKLDRTAQQVHATVKTLLDATPEWQQQLEALGARVAIGTTESQRSDSDPDGNNMQLITVDLSTVPPQQQEACLQLLASLPLPEHHFLSIHMQDVSEGSAVPIPSNNNVDERRSLNVHEFIYSGSTVDTIAHQLQGRTLQHASFVAVTRTGDAPLTPQEMITLVSVLSPDEAPSSSLYRDTDRPGAPPNLMLIFQPCCIGDRLPFPDQAAVEKYLAEQLPNWQVDFGSYNITE